MCTFIAALLLKSMNHSVFCHVSRAQSLDTHCGFFSAVYRHLYITQKRLMENTIHLPMKTIFDSILTNRSGDIERKVKIDNRKKRQGDIRDIKSRVCLLSVSQPGPDVTISSRSIQSSRTPEGISLYAYPPHRHAAWDEKSGLRGSHKETRSRNLAWVRGLWMFVYVFVLERLFCNRHTLKEKEL